MTAEPWTAAGGIVAAAVATGTAVALLVPARSRIPDGPAGDPTAPSGSTVHTGRRAMCCLLAGCASVFLVGGTVGVLAAPVVVAASWVALARAEPAAVRREREAVARDLPHLVELFAATLRSGEDPQRGLAIACAALPGAAADRLEGVRARLRLGADPAAVWDSLAGDPALGPLGRALARSHASGSPVVAAVERVGEDLERDQRAAIEDRARAVGVRAAVPLGLCLLPAFLLVGIVPTVAGLLGSITP